MKTLITRMDDYASSHAANLAIARAADAGLMKNISVMAVCGFVEEAAELLAARGDLCFGLHATLNAEWDKVRWGPLTGAKSLMDKDGFFPQDPAVFAQSPPDLAETMAEIEAQYQKLVAAGFAIRYAEIHMLPERFFPGLQNAMSAWCREKKLLDFSYFMGSALPHMDEVAHTPGLFEEVLAGLADGQYLYIIHPALYGEEMLQTGNAGAPGELVARMRDADATFAASPAALAACRRHGVTPIRLDEAVPGSYRVFQPGPIVL